MLLFSHQIVPLLFWVGANFALNPHPYSFTVPKQQPPLWGTLTLEWLQCFFCCFRCSLLSLHHFTMATQPTAFGPFFLQHQLLRSCRAGLDSSNPLGVAHVLVPTASTQKGVALVYQTGLFPLLVFCRFSHAAFPRDDRTVIVTCPPPVEGTRMYSTNDLLRYPPFVFLSLVFLSAKMFKA